MPIFSKKPTTVSGIFEAAIADVKIVQDKQTAIAKKLAGEQTARATKLDEERKALEDKFKAESAVNADAKSTADKEVEMAGTVVSNFANLFGIKDESKDS